MLFFLLDNISPRNDHPETSINIRHEYFTSTFDSKGGASQRVEGFLSKFNKNKKFSSPAFALRVSLLLLPACLRIRKMPREIIHSPERSRKKLSPPLLDLTRSPSQQIEDSSLR
jgi:hypothetical protein